MAYIAKYPAAIATDADLKIAANKLTTRLRSSVTAGDSLWTLTDASRIVAGMLLSCDDEIVSVSAVSGTSVTVVRAFDETTAANHAANRPVEARIDAWHHNALREEIQAVQTALGPNLSSLPGNDAIISRNYAWQRAGTGNLTVGDNVITLAPVPEGVTGSNEDHYVYISGGTGAEEPCLITGGTAVSGAGSGTLIFHCANTHSGAWAIGTATAGIQEAVHVASNSGMPIRITEGDNVIYAPITVPYNQVAIIGYGVDLSRVVFGDSLPTANGFVFNGPPVAAAAMGFSGPKRVPRYGMGVAGSEILPPAPTPLLESRRFSNQIAHLSLYAQPSKTSGWAILVQEQVQFRGEQLQIVNWPNGIQFIDANISQLSDIYMSDLEPGTGTGVSIEGLDSFVTRLERIVINGQDTTPSCLAGLRIGECADVIVTDSHFLFCNYGMLVDPGAGNTVSSVKCIGTYFDNCWEEGARISPATSGTVTRCDFAGCWFSDSKNGAGLRITEVLGGTINGVAVTFSQFYRNATNGLVVDGPLRTTNVRIAESVFAGNSMTTPGSSAGAVFNSSEWMFVNNRSGPADGFSDTQSYGIGVFAGGNYIITGNDFRGNLSSAIGNNGTGAQVVRNNLGTSNVVATIASAATINIADAETAMITGTNTVSTINPGINGRSIVLIFDLAGSGLSATGNIARAQSAAAKESIRLTFDAATNKWY